MRIVLASSLLLLGMLPGPSAPQGQDRIEARPIEARKEFANEPGWEWVNSTYDFQSGHRFGSASEKVLVSGYSVVAADTGLLCFIVTWTTPHKKDDKPYRSRLVLLDSNGKRHLPKAEQVGGFGNSNVNLNTGVYSIDPKVLGDNRVGSVGIERVVAKP